MLCGISFAGSDYFPEKLFFHIFIPIIIREMCYCLTVKVTIIIAQVGYYRC